MWKVGLSGAISPARTTTSAPLGSMPSRLPCKSDIAIIRISAHFSVVPNAVDVLLSLGAMRLLRSSHFALTQPDAFGAGESRGVWELWRLGEEAKSFLPSSFSPNLPAAKATTSFRTFLGELHH